MDAMLGQGKNARMSVAQPPPASPMQLPATWDAVAPGYAEELARHTPYAEEALRLAPPDAAARVLDVGTGPGVLALLAAPRVAHVDAIDFSSGMIEQVRTRAAFERLTNVHAAVMDAQALTFPDGTFDAAYSLFAFMFFPERARALAEVRRVLMPGARAVIATWAPIDRRPLMKVGFDALAEALPQLPPQQKGDLQTADDCIAEASAAGFRDVRVEAFTAGLRVGSPEHFVEMMGRTGAPFAALRKRLGEEAWAEAEQRLLAAVRRRIPQAGATLTAEALLTTGVK